MEFNIGQLDYNIKHMEDYDLHVSYLGIRSHLYHGLSYESKNYNFNLRSFIEHLLLKVGCEFSTKSGTWHISDDIINKTENGKKEGYHIDLYFEEKFHKTSNNQIDARISEVGILKSVIEYRNGKKICEYQIESFKGSAKFISMNFINGKLHGEYKEFYTDGFENNIFYGGYYKYGLKEGYWKMSDGNGFFLNGLKDGPWITESGYGKYENDEKSKYWVEDQGFGHYKNGERNGKWVIYENHVAEPALRKPIEVHYENGKKIIKDGSFSINYGGDPSKPWTEGQFENGTKQGKWVTYYESGDICSEIDYDHGNVVKERTILLNDEGFKVSDITIEKNKKHSIYFHKNGKVRRTIDYKYDETTKRFMKNGLLVKYDSKGKKIDEIKYLDDEEIY